MTDLALIRAETLETKSVIAFAKGNASDLVVSDEDSFALAQEVLKEIKRRVALLEERKAAYMKPLNALVKLVRDEMQPVLNAADEVERILKSKCVAYRSEVTRLRVDAEIAARALVEARAPVQEQRAALVAVAQAVAPKTTGVSYRDNWQGKVIDQSKVPEKYWMRVISQAMIDHDVASGMREIAGIEITNNVIMSVRK